ncbi:ferritin-like domain-containing protein [Paracoccus salsus]|uniref:ferritin-like domain-containing protein n=1 Tax=Paracoccus salsus TaxID=2911061 RepID=UPI001F1962FA|nr:ferritin-like protein [Paracoccus salsus]MCF3973984.1 ferritin-like protein [Paracoccus salsus]
MQALVQTAIDLEFSTLPPYLYALFSIRPDTNVPAFERLHEVIMEEMTHMCLACNIMNAIGGKPAINAPKYPGPLPGDVDAGLTVHLLPLSEAAMQQGMAIEEPSEPITPKAMAMAPEDTGVTIGEFYERLDKELKALPASAWTANRNQVDDAQFLQGQIFAVNNYEDAHKAIDQIVSEGEGTPVTPDGKGSPLDFRDDLAHYYRFWEISRNQLLVKDSSEAGYAWGPSLGVDWDNVYPAIPDPQLHDFSKEPEAAQKAQLACNGAYTGMIYMLAEAFNGGEGGMGLAVRQMFDLRVAARVALETPLADGKSVAGPAFINLSAPAASSGGQQQ